MQPKIPPYAQPCIAISLSMVHGGLGRIQKVEARRKKAELRSQKPLNQKLLPFLTKFEVLKELVIPSSWLYIKVGNLTESILPNRDKPKSLLGAETVINQQLHAFMPLPSYSIRAC